MEEYLNDRLYSGTSIVNVYEITDNLLKNEGITLTKEEQEIVE